MEMIGQVSIGKEYWSVIGPKRVTTGIWAGNLRPPRLFKDGFSTLTDQYSLPIDTWLATNSSLQLPDEVQCSRVDTDVLMEVAYSCNFLAVSDSSTCPDIGTSWCHAGIIEHFEIRGFKMTP